MRKSIILFLTILLISISTSVLASAGKALYVVGKVIAVDNFGAEKRIKRTDELFQGDTIITNARSQIQIRMSDGTLLAIRPNSKFKIDEYVHEKDSDTDKSHYHLLKGTFRSITGSIGNKNKKSYLVNTPVGTIGIRGTDFSARLCDSDCGDADNGLYVGVMQGEIVLNNNSGELNIVPGEYGYIQDQNIEPNQLDTSPGDLLFAHSETGTQTELADTSDSSVDSTMTSNSFASTTSADDTNIVLPIIGTNNEDLTTITDIAALDSGTDPVIDPVETGIVLPSTGTATYLVNSADPGTNLSSGTLDTFATNLKVDFIDPSATAIIKLNVNNNDWTGNTATMPIASDGTFSGNMLVSISDPFSPSTGTGGLTGSLSGSAEANIGAPSNANMAFDMSDGTTDLNGNLALSVDSTGPSN